MLSEAVAARAHPHPSLGRRAGARQEEETSQLHLLLEAVLTLPSFPRASPGGQCWEKKHMALSEQGPAQLLQVPELESYVCESEEFLAFRKKINIIRNRIFPCCFLITHEVNLST